jgi:iron complex outermembrane receptor protein
MSGRINWLTRAVVAAALAMPNAAFAQAADGTVKGVVKDSSGAGVPGAQVVVSNLASGVTRSGVSGRDGAYSVAVPAGTYGLTVSMRGFGTQTRRDVAVTAGAEATADFTLETRLDEEITVTATKREEALRDVPFSIAAPTEDMMRARGIDGVESLAANVAGFTVQNLGPGQSQVAMRGVSAGQIVRDQPGVKEQVGAYLDESVVSLSLFTPDLDLFDVNRVEVLRGPQGTLFGSGSLSGTVRYISNQPELGVSKWFAEFGGNTVQDGSQGGSVKLGGNARMGDKAALRIAGYYNRIAGFVDAVQPNLSKKQDVNGGDRYGFRAAATFAPSGTLLITPRVVWQKVEMDGWNRKDAYNILANPYTTTRPSVTLGDREQFTQIAEPFTDEWLMADLTMRAQWGSVDVTSVTSYTNRDILVVRDATALTASITGGSIGLPASVFTLNAPLDDATRAKSITKELRFSGASQDFKWVLGGFYSKTDRDYGQSLLVSGFERLSGIPTRGLRAATDVLFFSDLSYDLKQIAIFGEGTISLGEKATLTAGARFYDFEEDRGQIFDGLFGNDDNGTRLVSVPGDTNANGFAPRAILTWKANERTNVNAQVSRGFRLGGINDPLNVPLCTAADLRTFGGRETWLDEKAWNYEIGTKSRIMDGRGSFNASAFYMDIENLQATLTAGSCSSRVIFNVPKARSQGVELEFSAAPNQNVEFSVSGVVLDSQLRSSVTSTAPNGTVSVVSGIASGNRLPTVPKVQIAASLTLQRPMSNGALGYVTASFQHTGSRFTQIGDQDPAFGTVNLLSFAPNNIGGPYRTNTFTFDPELPAYDIVNLRVGYTRGRWDISAFANNLTDEVALLGLDQERGTRARVGYLINQPRTIGISARVNF